MVDSRAAGASGCRVALTVCECVCVILLYSYQLSSQRSPLSTLQIVSQLKVSTQEYPYVLIWFLGTVKKSYEIYGILL